jgi:Protein of unknown function (DUF2637)
MNDTLRGEQTPAAEGAMAGATSDTAGATPGPRLAAPATPNAVPSSRRKGGRGWPGVAGAPVSTAGASGHLAPATVATPPAADTAAGVSPAIRRALAVAALVGMIPVTVIGFAASYTTLARLAALNGFSAHIAPWIPLGIDGAIIAFLALDLYLTARRIPWPLLRFAAHGMTVATVVFNASDAGRAVWDDPVRAAWHGVMPLLFVVGVEGARRLLVYVGRLEDGTATDSIPLHRWVLAPAPTGRLYRRMRLANIRRYPEMVERERALAGYRVWLTQQHGGDVSKASETELLPITMAPQGYTVEEALALPAKWEAEAAERARAEAERARAEARRQAEQAKQDRIQALVDEGDVEEAQHQVTARTGTAAAQAMAVTAQAQAQAETAKIQAEHKRLAAERTAAAEAEALESADAAAARRRAARDNQLAAEAEQAAAAARLQTATAAATAQKAEAETERIAAERAAWQKQKLRDNQLAAEAEQAAAAARLQTAELEVRAQRAEDYARLSPRERNERRVARMIWAAGGDVEAVPLKGIMEELSVKQTAAGEIRVAATALLQAGYQPDEILDGGHRP